MHITLIHNPHADRGRSATFVERLRAWQPAGHQVTYWQTTHAGHGTDLARAAAAAGADVLAVAGGDGTVNEVLNGVLAAAGPEVGLGLIPIGSGNDLAFGLGLHSDVDSALDRLLTGRRQKMDVARIEDDRGRARIVANGIGIGFDATAAIESEKITRVHGFLMYGLAVLRTLTFHYESPQLTLTFDEEEVQQACLVLAVGVGRRVGGGFYLTPDASFRDGLLDSCLVNAVNRPTILYMLTRVMRGAHTDHKDVTMRRSRRLHIRSDRPLPIHIDGEIFAYPEDNVCQVTVTSLPAAVPVLVAPGATIP